MITIPYIILALLWATFATVMTGKLYPKTTAIKYFIAFVANAVLAPLTMIIAIRNVINAEAVVIGKIPTFH